MSGNDDDDVRKKTLPGFVPKDFAHDVTLPGGPKPAINPRSERPTVPLEKQAGKKKAAGKRTDDEPNPESSATKIDKKKVTFPPSMWDRQEGLVTSAETKTTPPTENAVGSITMSGDRLSEDLARAILNRRFEQAGYDLEADYQLRRADLLVRLDGFDPEKRVGYQFVSHADADVVTDFDRPTEMAIDDMRASGEAAIFVVHDSMAQTGDELVSQVNDFLRSLGHQID